MNLVTISALPVSGIPISQFNRVYLVIPCWNQPHTSPCTPIEPQWICGYRSVSGSPLGSAAPPAESASASSQTQGGRPRSHRPSGTARPASSSCRPLSPTAATDACIPFCTVHLLLWFVFWVSQVSVTTPSCWAAAPSSAHWAPRQCWSWSAPRTPCAAPTPISWNQSAYLSHLSLT